MLASVTVIINASAGLGYCGGWAAQLAEKFAAAGMDADITLAQSGEQMMDTARQAVAAGAKLVVAGGGDGTINAVASALVDSAGSAGGGVRFGVLPLGTLNHFAKDLGVPLELDQAIANLASGRTVKVDVGEVNGRIFLNNSSLGIYPAIVRHREQQQRKLGRGKWLAFSLALVGALRRFPFMTVKLSVNGEQHVRRTPFVFIGNNEYLQGWTMGARERLDGGTLSLYVAQRPTRLGLCRLALHALLGKLGEARDLDLLNAPELVIESRHRHMHVATDGEVTLMTPPLRYRSRPAALSVIVPVVPSN